MEPKSKRELLDASRDMEPVAGTVEVDIPIQKLWECFRRPHLWPRWNACFRAARNRDLVRGEKLVWVFHPIRWWYPYVMPASADIVEVEPQRKVTWEVTVLPGFFARHTYHMEDLGNGRTRFGSWEKATGPTFRLTKWFWIAHFVFVKDESLKGARHLERVYKETGKLDLSDHERRRTAPPLARPALFLFLLLLLAGLVFGTWFYRSFVRMDTAELAPGVTLVTGGGGNSLVVESGGEVLVVDPKFPPISKKLRQWVEDNTEGPVTRIVNSHYHYDHTQGNVLYPGARIYAAEGVREFLREDQPEFWTSERGLPTDAVRGTRRLTVGSEEVVLTRPETAHTHGDVWVHLPRHDIVATGDIVFHGYYPFLDTHPQRGASIPGMVRLIREWTRRFPDATFVPGHGPLATARDLEEYADYLETLLRSAEEARRAGLGPEEAERRLDAGRFHLSILPVTFNKLFIPTWSSARRNVEQTYELLDQPAAASGSLVSSKDN